MMTTNIGLEARSGSWELAEPYNSREGALGGELKRHSRRSSQTGSIRPSFSDRSQKDDAGRWTWRSPGPSWNLSVARSQFRARPREERGEPVTLRFPPSA